MKLVLFLCLLFLTTNYSQLYSQPITAFDSVVTNLIHFSPVNIYPVQVQDSFITKYQLRVDTIIEKPKKNYSYFRGYTKSYNPFSISFDSLEIQIITGVEPDKKGFVIYIIGHLPYTAEYGEKTRKEVVKLATEIEKNILFWSKSVSKKNAKTQYEAFYFRADSNSLFPHLGIGWAMNNRKKKTSLTLRIAYSIH